ncbi:MAG: hypothetical protein IJU99_05560 [Lachnospiraceae bacterium]|nr:hypothetical protein [Lachnospiraceae bacterium]
MKMKRLLAIVLAAVLCASTLTGCSGNPADTRAFTVNGTKVMMDEAMYYIYTQENAYSTYEQLYQMMYGFSFWNSTQDGTNSMSTVVKHEIVTMGAWYNILAKQAEEKGFTLSDEDQEQVAKDAQAVYDELTDVQKKKTGLTVESLTKVLTKIKLAGEYYVSVVSAYDIDRDAIRAGVSREDYRQYNIEMLEVTFSEGEDKMMDEADQKFLIKKIDGYVADAEAGKDLASLLDEDEKQIRYDSMKFIAKDIDSNEMYKVAAELENGKVTTYQSSASYYLIRMVDNDSSEAYENQVRDQIEAAEAAQFEQEYADLVNKTKISVSRYYDKLQLGTVTTDEKE